MPVEVNVINIAMTQKLFAQLDQGAFNAVLAQVAAAARDKWIQLASKQLNSTRADYVAGIQEVQLKDNVATIALVGQLPNMVEHGWPGGDMRDWMLSESAPHQDSIKTNQQGGRYRSIPFRHQTPGTRGTAGTAMGMSYQDHAIETNHKALGSRVHNAIKKLTAGTPLRTKTTGGAAVKGAHLRKSIAKLKPHHTANIYEGMIKKTQKIQKLNQVTGHMVAATQNTYMTFRTISEDSPIGWHHPGITAVHLADEVVGYVQKVAPKAFNAYVRGLQGG